MTARMVLRLSVIVLGSRHSIRFAAHFARRRFRRRVSVEPVQRRAEIVEHGREVAGERRSAAYQYIIMVRSHRYDVEPLHEFAKPAPDAIAFGGRTVLFGNGETDPDRAIIVAGAALHHEGSAVRPRAIGNGEKVRPLPQPIHE
jgi:hypothetical protein